jgi:8-oxo-dGTP diphosphatase
LRALLIRHARAAARETWTGDDRLRPLDGKGRRQAQALADTLASFEVTRLVSSPFVRCLQTLQPAAERLRLPIEERHELAEGAEEAARTLLSELDVGVPAISTHGDVIGALLGPGYECRKGAIWLLEIDGTRVRPERYLAPPA